MSLFDLILLILLGGFVLFGFWFGFFHTLGSLVGTIAGSFFAGVFHQPIADLLIGIFGHPDLVKFLTFVVIFLLFSRLVGFGFYVLDKIFGIVTKLPFISGVNHLLGGVTGFFEGVLVIGLSIYVLSRYSINPTVTQMLIDSSIAPWFVGASVLLQLLLPTAFREVRSVIGV